MNFQCFIVKTHRDNLVHSNRNADKWRRDRLKRLFAEQVGWRAKRLTPVGKATVWVGVVKGNRNIYDPVNLTDSMKPVMDALVSSAIFKDDNFKFVQGPWLFHLGHDVRLREVVEFVVCITPWGTSHQEAVEDMREFAHIQ